MMKTQNDDINCPKCCNTMYHDRDFECESCPRHFCCIKGAMKCLKWVTPNLEDILLGKSHHSTFEVNEVIHDWGDCSTDCSCCYSSVKMFIHLLNMNKELLQDLHRSDFVCFYEHFLLASKKKDMILNFNHNWYILLHEVYSQHKY